MTVTPKALVGANPRKCELQRVTVIRNMFGEVVKLVCLFLTVAVSSASCERFSSALPSHYLATD